MFVLCPTEGQQGEGREKGHYQKEATSNHNNRHRNQYKAKGRKGGGRVRGGREDK